MGIASPFIDHTGPCDRDQLPDRSRGMAMAFAAVCSRHRSLEGRSRAPALRGRRLDQFSRESGSAPSVEVQCQDRLRPWRRDRGAAARRAACDGLVQAGAQPASRAACPLRTGLIRETIERAKPPVRSTAFAYRSARFARTSGGELLRRFLYREAAGLL